MYCKDIRYHLRAYRKFCHNMLYPTQFLHNHKAKVFTGMVTTNRIWHLVQNRNTSRCVKAANDAELIQSVIRDYLADHWSFFLNIIINKRNITVGKYIFKSPKEKWKDKN